MKKKGFMFSIIMVLITLTIVQIIMVQREILFQKREEYFVKNRINDMNTLYDNIIIDSGKSLEIVAKRAMSISTSRVVNTGLPLTDADEVIEELVIDGTLNGTEELMMENSTIADWSQSMRNLGDLKGYYLNLTFLNLEVKPYDSFNLLLECDLILNITDKNGVASITRVDEIKKTVSVDGLEDPVYPLNTNGRITHKIYQTPYTNFTQLLGSGSGGNDWKRGITFVVDDASSAINCPNKSSKVLIIQDPTQLDTSVVNQYLGVVSQVIVTNATSIPYVSGISNVTQIIPNNTYILVDGDNGKVWYIENFVDHSSNGYYYTSKSGPSFLDRLEGKLYIQNKYSSQTSNDIGLESFVNKTNFIVHKLSVDTSKTNIDYLYFSSGSYSGNGVKSVDTYFRIDSNHTEAYGVDEILVE